MLLLHDMTKVHWLSLTKVCYIFQGVESSNIAETLTGNLQNGIACREKELKDDTQHTEISITNFSYSRDSSQLTQRKKDNLYVSVSKQEVDQEGQKSREKQASWRRILLLIIAITVHNIPGKML